MAASATYEDQLKGVIFNAIVKGKVTETQVRKWCEQALNSVRQ